MFFTMFTVMSEEKATEMVQWRWYGNASHWLQPCEVWNSHSSDHKACYLL